MLYAMFGLVVFTYVFLLVNFVWRLKAVKSRAVHIKFFRRLDTQEAPEHIILGTRHLANLFEMPVLFYVVGVLAVSLQLESVFMVVLAWLYVGCRVVHAIIHTTYNNVVHRMLVFQLGSFILLIIWLQLIAAYSTKGMA